MQWAQGRTKFTSVKWGSWLLPYLWRPYGDTDVEAIVMPGIFCKDVDGSCWMEAVCIGLCLNRPRCCDMPFPLVLPIWT